MENNIKKLILSFILLCLATMGLQAQNEIRPKIACPNNIWVNSYNGVLFYQRPDISVPNRSMPLEAVFYYNSSGNTRNVGYGNGWSLGYEWSFAYDSTGIVIQRGDGRKDSYTRYGDSYEAPAGVFEKLEQTETGYKLISKDGTQYIFDDTVSKRVTQIRDRYNNSLTFSYTNGMLTAITDISNRSILFAWTDSLMTQMSTSFDDRVWSYQYDTLQNLIRYTNPMGYASHYGYNRDNRIKAFTDPDGNTTHITYNDDGMAHRVKTALTDKSIRYELASKQTVIVDYLEDGNNQFSTYRWDDEGRVIEKKGNCCGYSSKLAYDNDNNVVRYEDANGNVTTYTYDQNGNMLSATDPMGYTERYNYEPIYNNITSYTDKMGNRYSFEYDANGNLIRMQAPLNLEEISTYNEYGQLLTHIDANGNTTTYAYDAYGNLISVTDALGHTQTMSYTVAGLLSSITNPNQATTQFTYNKMEELTQMVDPLQNTTRYHYDRRGNVTAIVDALHNRASILYDALNQPIVVTGPLNNGMEYQYNAKQKVTRTKDALNHATEMVYDDHDWLIMTIDALGDTTHYQYDNIGQVIAVVLPTGWQITYQYDALGRLVSVADQEGMIASNRYDANGNVIMTTDANGNITTYRYDALNRLVQTTNALQHSESYSYDNNGNRLTYTDRNGKVTEYTYNALNQLVEERNALDHLTRYGYDANGNLASVTDANNHTTAYQYDVNDQLSQITFANGKTRRFWYDANGNLSRQQDEAGRMTEFSYDALDRMTAKRYADNRQDTYSYDLVGNMLSATNEEATVTFTYDEVGNLLSETLNGKATQYANNTAARTVDITYPSGRSIQEQYDVRSRLTGITEDHNTLVTFAYHVNDQLAQRSYANGTTANYSYDAANRLTGIVENGIMQYAMGYDHAGNMLYKQDVLHPSLSEAYQYDDIHRLIAFQKGTMRGQVIPNPTRTIQYALDALGNRTTMTENQTVSQYTANEMNAYTMVSGAVACTPQYDDNGNMISDGMHSYQYNDNNRMVSVDNGATALYQYDALNRRIRKQTTQNGVSTTLHYYYAGDQVIEDRDGSDQVVATYLFGNSVDDVLQMQRGGDSYYYHKNYLGSVVALTDASGSIVEIYEYDPYGVPTIYYANHTLLAQSTVGNAILFTGRDYDYETGLYYYRARTMNPQLGRFMQNDPLLFVNGMNMYSYVGNRVTKNTDPFGLAYFQSRPLAVTNFFFGRGFMINFPCSDWHNINISHEHIFFDDGSNIGWGKDGIFTETDTTVLRRYRGARSEDFDDELLRYAIEEVRKADGKKEYSLFKNNCQDWAERVRRKYYELESSHEKDCIKRGTDHISFNPNESKDKTLRGLEKIGYYEENPRYCKYYQYLLNLGRVVVKQINRK